MADDSNFEVPKRRRREQSTDYDQRLGLLKSGTHRAVVRTSNNHTRVHFAAFDREGDQNMAQTVSEELAGFGWSMHTGNLPAAYLTGFLAGHRFDGDSAVLDPGLRTVKSGGRVFAAVKGIRDAGVELPAGEEMFPDEHRLEGGHIEEMKDVEATAEFEKVKQQIEEEFE
jgi:large subunit ribosomal protein L18